MIDGIPTGNRCLTCGKLVDMYHVCPKAVMACGRCQETLLADEAQYCWYCGGYLCAPCWDDHGHCGHLEADRQNKEAAARHAELVRYAELLRRR